MTTENFINRRKFLASASAVSAGFTIIPHHVLGGNGHTAANDKINIAGIGIGGMGAVNLKNLASQNIVALCDVDDQYAAKVFEEYPNAKRYKDYRQMLADQKDIDAVMIATPDHTHAVIAMAAMKAGKHIYCQKPLTHNVHESRVLTQTAKETGVVTQMGIQMHSSNDVRILREWIADGAIGNINEVVAWSTLSYYPWGHAWWSSTHSTRPEEMPEVPSTLDWDLWLGPAAYRPYHPCYHPAKWRAWLDFGCGMMGDRGVHTFDPIFWALDLKYPDSIEATSLGGNNETHPLGTIVTYRFPSRGDKPAVKLTWYDGFQPPRPVELEDGRQFGSTEGGILFVGDKGKIMSGYLGDSPRIIPESKMKAYKRPIATIPRIEGTHEQDWIRAIKEGSKAGADFDYSGPLNEAVLLGNVAKRVDGKMLLWDGANMKISNNIDANQYLKRQYREPWSL